MTCRRIALLVEGDGDQEAIPLLLRKLFVHREYHDCIISGKPIKCGDLTAALQSEKFLKLYNYAAHDDRNDGVVISLDCDDHCPVQAVAALYVRISEIARLKQKPTGIVLFRKEYESMFLANASELGERSERPLFNDGFFDSLEEPLEIRNAKGVISRAMLGTTYKERRDQPRLTDLIDVGSDAVRYRPLAHLINVIDWLYAGPRHGFTY